MAPRMEQLEANTSQSLGLPTLDLALKMRITGELKTFFDLKNVEVSF